MGLILEILVGVIIVIVLWWYVEYYKWNKYLGKYPGPLALPVIGHAYLITAPTDIFPVNLKLQKKYGGIFKTMILHLSRLIIAESKSVECLLSSPTIIKKSYEYNFGEPWLGSGLLTSFGAKWRRQRKLITPSFHFQILEQYLETFNAQSDILIEILKKEANGHSFDVFPYITLYTFDVINESAMGIQVGAQKDPECEYVRNVRNICKLTFDRGFSPLKMLDCFFKLTKGYQKQKHYITISDEYTTNLIRTKRRELLNNANKNSTNEFGIKNKMAFLDLLLQCNVDGEPLTDKSIRDEINTFMFEGHDTTSSGISFALYNLSKHSEVQNIVVEELKTIFGEDKNRHCTHQDLQDMKYLEMVIKESMRLYPPVPYFSRVLEEDSEFNGGMLPKGMAISVSVFGLHRQEDVFPDPEKFDPDRFLPENIIGRSPYAYIPFSAGPRNCIGQRFAMMEMKVALSNILRNYELLPVDEHTPILSFEVIIKSANGLHIRLKKRNL